MTLSILTFIFGLAPAWAEPVATVRGENGGTSVTLEIDRSDADHARATGHNAGHTTDVTISRTSDHRVLIQGRNGGASADLVVDAEDPATIGVTGRNAGFGTDLIIQKLSDTEYLVEGLNAGSNTKLNVTFVEPTLARVRGRNAGYATKYDIKFDATMDVDLILALLVL